MLSPVPYLVRSLRALSAVIGKADAHCSARRIDPKVLISDRLYPDMLPFVAQVQIATDHTKGAASRLSGAENPRFEDNAQDFADLVARIERTIAFLESIPPADFDGCENRTVTLRLGGQDMAFPAPDYLYSFAIPNFYFHMTTAYNILRHNGVELGKVDFIGRP